jgi:hypothetical protein
MNRQDAKTPRLENTPRNFLLDWWPIGIRFLKIELTLGVFS